jgi:molybdate transport system regulatory protein
MKEPKIEVRSKVWLEVLNRPFLGPGRQALLRAVDEEGSISRAAKLLRMTYRRAWGQIKGMEEQLGLPLVIKQTGGQGGGGAVLTPEARDLLAKYGSLIDGVEKQIDERFGRIFFHGNR